MLVRVWKILAGLAAVAVVGGWLPVADAVDVGVVRSGPVLGFLVAVTVLAELADAAGVFELAAVYCARLARGSTPLLFVLVAVLATVTTVGMSLDTTAVLLTPVVLAVTDRLGLRPLPFALLVVWLANTASLLLPVSNLTNLLALQHADISTVEFASRMALPELVAVVGTTVYLGILFRRSLMAPPGGDHPRRSVRYAVPSPQRPDDPVSCAVCAVACAGFAGAVLAGVAPWLAATAGALAALTIFALRGRKHLHWNLFPWRLVITTEGLFLVVAALVNHGLGDLLTRWTDHSGARTTAVAAAASNLINNLPAYLAMETAVPAGTSDGIFDVLLGTNIGPLITMWGSLATLLWADRLRARGVVIRPITFAAIGLLGAPLLLLGTWAVLPR
ncbi:SLC13 family permease [Nocardia arthritidis]|uniref:Arsenic transporter n=1 Tax=Nocardia arthritidis TaxID=228602 RepID=A0A6G9Y9P1_9NOCA|nr:SLC13 family permease [Nocardia arthritidis]QIS09766.1 arsenic transporter [Nocardia arthritidis]